MMPVESSISPIFSDLGSLIDNYCDARANASNTSNSSSNATLLQIFSQLDIPWSEWAQDALTSFSDVATWLGRYQQYLAALLGY